VHWTQAGPQVRGVGLDGEHFAWQDHPIDNSILRAPCRRPESGAGLSVRINLAADALIASLAHSLEQGLILLIELWFWCKRVLPPAAPHGHAARAQITATTHWTDPFYLPGLV